MSSALLADTELHIYVIRLDQPGEIPPDKLALLSPDEVARAERFQFDHLRRRFVICRSHLRELLASYLETDPEAIRFHYTDKDKPYLASPSPSGKTLSFNISHSDDIAVMAFAWDMELGIDVENLTRKTDMDGIAKRYFSKAEFDSYLAVPVEQRTEAFYQCWTSKEAFMKAKGQGFSMELSSFSVELRPDHPPQLLWVSSDPNEVGRWQFYRFRPQENAIATLAYEAEDIREIHHQPNLP